MTLFVILAIGFGVMAVLYPWRELAVRAFNLDDFIIVGWYVFFCLFMTGVSMNQKHVMHYCGFLRTVVLKACFYVFLASLALANYNSWVCWTGGAVFVGVTVLNFIRLCGRNSDTHATMDGTF